PALPGNASLLGVSDFSTDLPWPRGGRARLSRWNERGEMSEEVERETMEFDVVIVGAGPAGLAAAIRLKQLAAEKDKEVSVVVLEKGSEVGAHILSGAVLDPVGLNKLIPDWRDKGAPVKDAVSEDHFYYLTSET